MARERERRLPILGPAILITIGVLALMQNYGQLPANFWHIIVRLWPIILVLIGVEILLGQLRLPWVVSLVLSLIIIVAVVGGVVSLAWQAPQEWTPESGEMWRIEKELQGVTSASVRLSFGMGQLRVGSVGGNNIMVGDFAAADDRSPVNVDYAGVGGRGDLRVTAAPRQAWSIFRGARGNEWDVRLNNTIPLDLRIEAGMGTNTLDLTDLTLSNLRLDAGMSTSHVRLPKTGDYTARITGGFSSTTVVIPDGVAARIRVQGGLSSITVDTARFAKVGDTYSSPGYETATHRVNLVIEGGFASVSVQ